MCAATNIWIVFICPSRVGFSFLSELLLFVGLCLTVLKLFQFVGNLKKLTHLDVSENCLEDIPADIGECRQLTELTLSSNDIRVTNLLTRQPTQTDLIHVALIHRVFSFSH